MDKVFLKQNPTFFSRLGFCYDPPLLDENGEPIVFSKNFEKYAKFHKDMLNAGVNIQTCIVHAGWVGVKNGVNQYDYSLTDKTLDALQGIGEDAYLLPRVKLNVPVEWCRENPEEVFVYPEGPRTADQIKELVGTLRQDWLGYNSPKGYYQAQEYEDKRPNVDSLIGLQSLSSKKWLQDAGEALKSLIAYLKTKPYYDRIIGFHVCFGPCGENMQWGRQSRHYGDYGISNLRNFYEYGLRKYGSIEVLSEKWQQEDLSPDNVDVPNPEIRYWRVHDINTLFRGKQEDIICRDFDEFLSKSVTNAIDYFGGIVKQETQNKLVGAFYGYFLYVANPSYAGHLDLDGCLASKNIDFLAAPKPYYRMLAGEPNGDMTAVASVNLDKVWMEEIDCRTNLIQDESERHLATDTFDETFYVFWRNVCKNISQGSGFWWMDLGGGWFNSPIIHQEIKKINDFLTKVGVNGKSVADILIVVDEKSIYDMRETKHLYKAFMEDFICETRRSGALCDVYRLSDLHRIDLSKYKLVVFAYDFNLTKEEIENLSFAKDCTFMFNYCAGVRCGESISLTNSEKLTGFALKECEAKEYDFPEILIVGTETKIAKKQVRNRTHVMNVKPYLQAEQIRKIAEDAGCKIYTDKPCIVYGNDKFLSVFSMDEYSGKVWFDNEMKGYAYFSGKTFAGKEIDLTLSKNCYEIFIFEQKFFE